MNKIINDISSREELAGKLEIIAEYFFSYNQNSLKKFKETINFKIENLEDDVSFVIEYPYLGLAD